MIMKTNQLLIALLLSLIFFPGCGQDKEKTFDPMQELERYHVVWNTMGEDASDSIPIGNGDVGLNVWSEKNGDILFYIAKSDAWSENHRLLKTGRVRIKVTPNPFRDNEPFSQELNLTNGTLTVKAGALSPMFSLRLWVDANRPVVNVETSGAASYNVTVSLEHWRTERRALSGEELHSAYGMSNSPDTVWVEPDAVISRLDDRVVWFHRNERSIYDETLMHQGLGELVKKYPDPLIKSTFGGCIKGDRFRKVDDTTLTTSMPDTSASFSVYLMTRSTNTVDQWLDELQSQIAGIDSVAAGTAYGAHVDWWRKFWNRSWIFAGGTPEAETVTRAYVLQNWINACAGRGKYPIKFNGSLFTVDADLDSITYDADYRRWGGPYWFQNTRLPYWSMLAAGNFDMMTPLFDMYIDALPLAKERTRIYYSHNGAYFPETMYFWGTYVNDNYGWEREGLDPGTTVNQYIRYEWQGGIELVMMMLDYYDYTGDDAFLSEKLLPFAEEILTFYDEHYKRTDEGIIRLEPAQALETWWDSVDPMPEIAGLHAVIGRLVSLPEETTGQERRQQWVKLMESLPPVPTTATEDGDVLAAAAHIGTKHNLENPELYALFPYRLYGLGRPDMDIARLTFDTRDPNNTGGWRQDAIWAAMLGIADTAGDMVADNASRHHEGSRFPAFWGPNYDWIPDQDHGSITMTALQHMLLQHYGDNIILSGAWPKEWDVNFKLHAPGNTVITGSVRHGVIKDVKVSPTSRLNDVEIHDPQ